ncbi:radixin-like isoform X2 [Penaeus monodon]|uniref:radixin-like isoform X2 n=1 Tax=Penaeus monodon TaxID=6687 RepID=UPI0018A7A3EB|nr:radixin-like isoform X2 [Penaeus monodon]
MTRKLAHIVTGIKDVDLVIEAKTKGWQMLLDIALAVGMQQTFHTLWFGIQYVNKKGHRKWIKDNRYVLDHRLDTRKKPLQFTLRVKVFPKNFSVIDDDIAQVLIYKQLREHIEQEELNCLPDKFQDLAKLAEEDKIQEYMKTVQGLEQYGKKYFKLISENGARVDITLSHSGIAASCRNESFTIPIKEIQDVKANKRTVCITKEGRASKPLKYKSETPRYCKEAVEAVMSYLEVFRQTGNGDGESDSKEGEVVCSPDGEAMVKENSPQGQEGVDVSLKDDSKPSDNPVGDAEREKEK